MADGHFPTLVSKDRSSNAVANPIYVQLVDGTDSVLIDGSGNLQVILAANDGVDIGDVTINNAAGTAAVNIQDGGNVISVDDAGGSLTVDGSVTVSATQLDIDDLNATDDNVAISDGTDTLAVNADGSINVVTTFGDTVVDDTAFAIGTDKVFPMGALADETTPDSVDEGDIGAPRMTLDRKLLTRIVGATDANRLDIDASGHAQVDIAAASVNVPVTDAGGSLTVDAVQLDIDDLDAASDNVAISDGTDTLAIAADGSIAVTDNGTTLSIDDGAGSITVDGTVAATQSGTWNIGTVTSITNDVNIADGGNSITVDATDLDIRALTLADDAVKVSANATANSETNPIFVQTVSGVVSGTEVHDYDTAAAVAGDATDNHDYTASGGTFLLKQITLSASGGAKVEVINDAAGTPATVWVGFVPKEGGSLSHEFTPPVEVADTNVLRLTRTNRQGSAQDLYSTIEGNQL